MSTTTNQASSKLQHIRLQDMPVEHLNPLMDRQFVAGERTMLARIILRKGSIVPQHSHDNEQITYVLEGALKFVIEGKELIVRGGKFLSSHPTCRTAPRHWRIPLISIFFVRLARTGSVERMHIYASNAPRVRQYVSVTVAIES